MVDVSPRFRSGGSGGFIAKYISGAEQTRAEILNQFSW
jgi:hypothetical protein